METKEYYFDKKEIEDKINNDNIKEVNKNNFNKENINKTLVIDISTNFNSEESKAPNSPIKNSASKNNNENLDIINLNKVDCSSPKKKTSIEDYEISHVLGKGSYAKVVLAKNIHTSKNYALKIIDKKFLKKEKKENHAIIERNILMMMNHPNIISLHSTFQDPKKLYFILEYCPNRDMADFLKTQGILSFELAQFYAAEIVLGIEYIHSKGIYHRDLKPENIVLDEKMHLKITDFATAAIKDKIFDKKIKSFVPKPANFNEDLASDKIDTEKYHIDQDLIGTPEYISPEALFLGESSPSVDLWALGCIIYLFFHGVTPFKDKNNSLIFDKIKCNDYKLKEDLNGETKHLIENLLVKDPKKRIGGGSKEENLDISALKKHKFFEKINFDLLNKQQPPINLKKVNYSKLKNNNSTDDILGIQLNTPVTKQSLFNNKNLFLNKNISNQNLAFKTLDNMKEEIEILYGRNTGENYDINKTPFDEKESYGNPFTMVDLSEEFENICHHFNNKTKEYLQEDKIILEDVVQKKSPWFYYNKRILKLFKSGKMEYYLPTTFKLRGTIILDNFCQTQIEEDKKFNLITKSRKFIFKLTDTNALDWVNKINEMISQYKSHTNN